MFERNAIHEHGRDHHALATRARRIHSRRLSTSRAISMPRGPRAITPSRPIVISSEFSSAPARYCAVFFAATPEA